MPFPDGHALLEVLLFDLVDADRFDRALNQVVTFLHRLFIATGRPGYFTGNVEFDLLGWIKRVFQYGLISLFWTSSPSFRYVG